MIGILTYNVPHRKTFDALCLLKAKGYNDVVVFAKPFHYKKRFQPIYSHRPQNMNDLTPEKICSNFEYEYHLDASIEDNLPKGSIILVCGAGIIDQKVIDDYRVINAHPGFIPNVRGLDALKWSIYEKEPIGVTTHMIGDEIDAGLIIDRKNIEIFESDTFHAVAQRVYEAEIGMLIDAIEGIESANEIVSAGDYILHKRMPKDVESTLLSRFEEAKAMHIVKCNSNTEKGC